MKKDLRLLAAFMTLAFAALACSSSFDVVKTPAPVAEQNPSPTVAPDELLPHTFYYLSTDTAGLTQVFRIARDGKDATQLTSESAGVMDYDVSLADGSVAYVTNHQLVLVNADGSNRHVLVDGVSYPVFSPDGKTLAYSRNGLNLYDLSTGIPNLVLEDHSLGGALPPEIYVPQEYSPDGTKLLLKIGHPPDSPWTGAIYTPATQLLQQFAGSNESITCCDHYGGAAWSADSSSFYAVARVPDSSSAGGELWKVDAATGAVSTLISGGMGDGTNIRFNFPYKPYLAPDGQLYYFFLTFPESAGYFRHAPLQLVRSASDGVTNLTVLRPDTFEFMNEALWSPDAGFVIVASAPAEDVYDGGEAEIVYLDGRPNVVLTPFAQEMKWGP